MVLASLAMSIWNLRPLLLVALVGGLTAEPAEPAAAGAAVSIAPVAIGETLQKALKDRYGVDEAQGLEQAVTQSLARSLKGVGAEPGDAAPIRIEVLIDSATPTHPTRRQLNENPSLDYLASVSRGGAELRAVLRNADGQVLDRVAYDYYAYSLREASMSGGAWGDAYIAIDRFADQVAKHWRRLTAAAPASS
jgi:hypothetical protein